MLCVNSYFKISIVILILSFQTSSSFCFHLPQLANLYNTKTTSTNSLQSLTCSAHRKSYHLLPIKSNKQIHQWKLNAIVDILDEFDDDFDLNSNANKSNKIDDIISPADDLVIDNFTSKLNDIFELVFSGKEKKILNKDLLVDWESKIMAFVFDIKNFQGSKAVLLELLYELLSKVSYTNLNPFQYTTYDMIANAIIDNLLQRHPANEPITDLIDILTDKILSFIDKFVIFLQQQADDDYNSSFQEFLCYQFAGLITRTFLHLTKNLGESFDSTSSVQNLRLSNWVSPVYARLQRRFVRFSTSYVEEKVNDIIQESYDQLLNVLPMEIQPKWNLAEANRISTGSSFASWELADTIIKFLRNTVYNIDDINALSLEAKVLRTFQNEFSIRMRPYGKILESMYDRFCKSSATISSIRGIDDKLRVKELKAINEMMNVGNSLVAASFVIWHVRHNIVGVVNSDGTIMKDYLQPITTFNAEAIRDCIPKVLRFEVLNEIESLKKQFLSNSSIADKAALEAFAILAYSIRITIGEDLRALIIYNSDSSDWPQSRDDTFKGLLIEFLVGSLLLDEQGFDSLSFYRNLIAFAALEEGIGIREPRSACIDGFRRALKIAALSLISTERDINIAERASLIETALGMMLRLPENSSSMIKNQAFKDCVDTIVASTSSTSTSLSTAGNMKVFDKLASILGIDSSIVTSYVIPLIQSKFDKMVGSMLLNSDLVLSMPSSMGDTFINQIFVLADQISMSRDDAMKRVCILHFIFLLSNVNLLYATNR